VTGWWHHAACDDGGDPADVRVTTCRTCPVWEPCLTEALNMEDGTAKHEVYYIRGGCRSGQRWRALRDHGTPAAAFDSLAAKEQPLRQREADRGLRPRR